MKRKTIRMAVLGAVAAAAVLGARITPTWAYFTANAEAVGSKQIKVIPEPWIDEIWEENTKKVTIHSDANSEIDVFVRAKVYANEKYLAEGSPSGDGWTYNAADGYWYYMTPLEPGGETASLDVKVEWPSETITPEGSTPIDHTGENFNIIVVYEATPVQYKDGQLVDPMSSDCNWDLEATE